MAHMTYSGGGAACASGECATQRVVSYTATGAEGVDFSVPIGATLSADTYDVGLLGTAGSANFPVLDFPNALAGDRTTTAFRVLSAATLTAGDILKFLLIEA